MSARVAALVVSALVCASPAVAQTGEPRLEISAGAFYAGGHDLVDTNADLVQNQPGGGPYTLFKTETRMDAAPGFEARVGWRLTPRFIVEGGVFLSRPQLQTSLSGDVEGAPDITAAEDLSLYIFDGALNVALGAPDKSVTPFVRAGVGYVRQLHEDNVLVETGQAYHFGGGVNVWFGRSTGVRLDARVYMLQGGIDLGASSRTMITGGGTFVYAF